MKGFTDKSGKFRPITDYNKKGTRKSRDQSEKTQGVRMERDLDLEEKKLDYEWEKMKAREARRMPQKDAKTSIGFLEKMILAKKEQIKNEPDEPIWKDELRQLYGAKELIEMDFENFSERF